MLDRDGTLSQFDVVGRRQVREAESIHVFEERASDNGRYVNRDYPPKRLDWADSNARASQATGISTGAPGCARTGTEQPWFGPSGRRMQRVPAFVRGMVIKSVELHCRKNGVPRVTVEELDRIRSRMPASRVFGRRS